MTPRPASERLVAAVVERIGATPARVVDVGTGAGAIAVGMGSWLFAGGTPASVQERASLATAAVAAARHEATA